MKNEDLENSSFVETLEGIAFGTSLMDIDRKLKKCVKASLKTGKMSTLTVTLKLKPVPGDDANQINVSDVCKANIPEPEHGETVMYGSENNELLTEHPFAARKAKAPEEFVEPSGPTLASIKKLN